MDVNCCNKIKLTIISFQHFLEETFPSPIYKLHEVASSAW